MQLTFHLLLFVAKNVLTEDAVAPLFFHADFADYADFDFRSKDLIGLG